MKLEQYLQKIGLSEKEAQVYLAGLQIGAATMQELVNASKLKRATVYDVVDSLREQGLMKVIMKGKRRTYLAEEPQSLFSFLKQKETTLQTIFGQLEALQLTGNRPAVKIYQGVEGMKEIYEDIISRRSRHIEVLSEKTPDPRIVDYWQGEYIQRRIKKGNSVRIIAPDTGFYRKFQEQDKYSLRETRLVPSDKYPWQNEIYVYRGKVAYVTHEGDQSLGLVVESRDIAQTMELVLNFIWEALGKQE